MEFSAREDIEAPIEKVFEMLTDINHMERQALRRNIKVRRLLPQENLEVGMHWNVGFKFRGRDMVADVMLTELERPETLKFQGQTKGLETGLALDLTVLSSSQTRLTVNGQLKPRTLSTRLLVQSLKLAKGRVTRKFTERVSQFAKKLEERARA